MTKKKKAKEFKLGLFGYEIAFSFNKEDRDKGAKFLGAMLVLFFALNFLFSLPLIGIEYVIASIVSFVLNLFGIANATAFEEPALILIHNIDVPIAISYLCTGILETALLVAAIATSFGISTKKRLLGIAGAIAGIQLFNLFRILTTIFLIINFNLEVAELGHELLFRLFLLIVIAGFYSLWFFWATKKETK